MRLGPVQALLDELHRRSGDPAAAGGVVAAFASKVAAIGAVFLAHLVLVRLFGAGAYGDFAYAYAWFAAVLPFAALGIQNAAIRFVPDYHAGGRFDLLRGFLGFASGLALAVPAAVAAIAAAATWLLGARLAPDLALCLLLAWATLPVAALGTVYETALRGLKRIVWAQVPPEVLRPLLAAALSVLALRWLGRPALGSVATAAMLGATALTVALSALGVWRALGGRLRAATAERRERQWLDLALHMMGLTVILAIMYRVDVLMLGALAGTRDAGIYSLAVRVVALVPFGYHTLNVVTLPLISEYHSTGRLGDLRGYLSLCARSTTLLAALVVAAMALTGRPFLRLYDAEFVAGYWPLVILAVGQLAYVAAGPGVFLLALTGRQRLALLPAVASALLNLALNALLIPRLGMVGAALATSLSTLVWSGLNVYFARTRTRVSPAIW